MHHAGCTTNISDLHARRVLGRSEYRKFVDDCAQIKCRGAFVTASGRGYGVHVEPHAIDAARAGGLLRSLGAGRGHPLFEMWQLRQLT